VKPAAVVFDLFGTLLDIGSLRDAASVVAGDPAAFVATWREKQLAYAFASAIMGAHEDFDAMTEHGLRYAAAKHGVVLAASDATRLVEAWQNVAPYPDAVPALRALGERGLTCAVLTNGTPATSAAAIRNAGIEALLDATLSVESAGVFKPDRRVYALVTERYGVAAERLVFVTANGWDATGAAAFGMRVVWCNRLGAPAETFGPRPEWTLPGLAGLDALLAGADPSGKAARTAAAE
jgi:2-haloacid dehalogenase